MKKLFVSAVAVALLLSGCATSKDDPGEDALRIEVVSSDISPMMLRSGGRMGVEMQLEVTNRLSEPVTLRSVELNTVAEGAFAFRSDTLPRSQVIAAHDTAVVRVRGWGYSSGGRTAEDEPITLRGVARFDRANNAHFQRVFMGIIQRQ